MITHIVFAVGSETFAMDVNLVKEVCIRREFVRVPNSQPFMLGMVSLRGRVIPVMDLALRIGIDKAANNNYEIIVTEIKDQVGAWLLGLSVNSILGLDDSDEGDIQSLPQLPGDIGKFISGTTKETGYYIIDLEKVCSFS